MWLEFAVHDRWLSYLIWQSILSTPIYLLSTATTHLLPRPVTTLLLHLHLPLFLLSLLLSFVLSLPLASPDVASPAAILCLTFSFLLFGNPSRVEDATLQRWVVAAGRLVACVLVCGVAGVLSAVAISGLWDGLKGVVYGLGYGGWFVWTRRRC